MSQNKLKVDVIELSFRPKNNRNPRNVLLYSPSLTGESFHRIRPGRLSLRAGTVLWPPSPGLIHFHNLSRLESSMACQPMKKTNKNEFSIKMWNILWKTFQKRALIRWHISLFRYKIYCVSLLKIVACNRHLDQQDF